MRLIKAVVLSWTLGASGSIATAGPVSDRYPGKSWGKADPSTLGWSNEGLAAAKAYFNHLPPASVVVIDHGREIAEWGDAGKRIKISSMRKSLLSALYGIYAPGSHLSLDSSLEEVGIDDDPPLTPDERRATLRMLLEARSGVYHGYVAGTPDMREAWPTRGSRVLGPFWFYNTYSYATALGKASK